MGQYDEYLVRSKWDYSEWAHRLVARNLVKLTFKICNLEPEKAGVLEIGTGTGRIAAEFLKLKTKQFLAIEPTTALREHVESSLGITVFPDALPNLTSLKIDSDIVFSLHVLEHAPTYHDARSWVKEMARVTKPGGFVVIAAPNILDFKEAFWDSDWSHGYPTSPNRVRQLVDDIGLEVKLADSVHVGLKGRLASTLCHLISVVLPTRLFDRIGMTLVRRPLGTGLKIALIWGLTFVVAQKPVN